MARKRRKLKQGDTAERPKKMKDPDPNSEEYIYDEVDKFHRNKDKILLDATQDEQESEIEEEEEEEVLGISDSDDDSNNQAGDDDKQTDEEASDEEDEEILSEDNDDNIEQGLPSDKAWGKSKKVFYDADVDDDDVYASDEEADLAAAEEEKEAMTLQRRMAEKLDMDDFYEFDEKADDDTQKEKEANVAKDLSKLSKREKLKILEKESPELLPLLDEYKNRFAEVQDKYHPLLLMARKGLITSKEGVLFIEMKHQLLLNYLVNISFYLALKASKDAVKGHPVIDTLVQHQQLLQQMEPLDEKVAPEIEALLTKYKEGGFESQMTAIKTKEKGELGQPQTSQKPIGILKKKTRKRRKATDANLPDPKMDPLEYYNLVKEQSENIKIAKKNKVSENDHEIEEEENEDDEEGKRKITYEMSKNKGLTRKRKKELKNPRVKHKMKFRKAKIKHKGQVREVRKEMGHYGGESTGIKANLARSVKIN